MTRYQALALPLVAMNPSSLHRLWSPWIADMWLKLRSTTAGNTSFILVSTGLRHSDMQVSWRDGIRPIYRLPMSVAEQKLETVNRLIGADSRYILRAPDGAKLPGLLPRPSWPTGSLGDALLELYRCVPFFSELNSLLSVFMYSRPPNWTMLAAFRRHWLRAACLLNALPPTRTLHRTHSVRGVAIQAMCTRTASWSV